jgi:hypothetical protein
MQCNQYFTGAFLNIFPFRKMRCLFAFFLSVSIRMYQWLFFLSSPRVTAGPNFIFPIPSTTYNPKSNFTVRRHSKLALKRSSHA